MKFIYLFIFFFFSFNFVFSQKQTILRIEPKYAIGGTASQMFDEINYIPLETTKESTFSSVQNLQVSKNYFVFFDYETKADYIFTKNGKFSGKIIKLPTKIGGFDKPESYQYSFLSLRNFVLDVTSEHIYITYYGDDKINSLHLAVYDPKGTLLESKRINNTESKLTPSFAFLDSNRTLFLNKLDDGSTPSFSIMQNFDSIIKEIKLPAMDINLPQNQKWINGFSLKSIVGYNSIWKKLNKDYKIYFVNQDGNLSIYQFIFPAALSLDSSFYKTSFLLYNIGKGLEYFRNHREKINNIETVFKSKGLFWFTLQKGNSYSADDTYFYSFKTQNLYSYSKIATDSMSCYLPYFSNVINAADEGGNIYLNIPSFQMFQSVESTKDKRPNYPTILREYFRTQSRKSNPVIVQLKLKDNL